MNANIDSLGSYIKKLHPLPEEAWKDFSSIWSRHSYKRKEIITKAGEKESYLYFVCEGVQRVFLSDEEGKESTLVLTYPHSFGGVIDSFLLETPSRYFYETLSASVLLRARHDQLMSAAGKHPEIDSLVRKATHVALAGLLERMAELQSLTSAQKMQKLLERSPQILNLVSHRYLANYLGIDPTNFSKLLNSVKF